MNWEVVGVLTNGERSSIVENSVGRVRTSPVRTKKVAGARESTAHPTRLPRCARSDRIMRGKTPHTLPVVIAWFDCEASCREAISLWE